MRLLIAEDEKALADALTEILTLHKYSVDTVYDGEEALDYLNSAIEYDCIILDIMMPKVDSVAAGTQPILPTGNWGRKPTVTTDVGLAILWQNFKQQIFNQQINCV